MYFVFIYENKKKSVEIVWERGRMMDGVYVTISWLL
jgi:hypothetical protein